MAESKIAKSISRIYVYALFGYTLRTTVQQNDLPILPIGRYVLAIGTFANIMSMNYAPVPVYIPANTNNIYIDNMFDIHAQELKTNATVDLYILDTI